MDDAGLLNTVITEFCSKKASMKPDEITSADMGYIFEELIRKFSESYDEQAGAHFTARDIIYLMTELLVINDKDELKKKMNFENVTDKREEFFKESEEFSGKEVEVKHIKIYYFRLLLN